MYVYFICGVEPSKLVSTWWLIAFQVLFCDLTVMYSCYCDMVEDILKAITGIQVLAFAGDLRNSKPLFLKFYIVIIFRRSYAHE